MLDGMGVTPSPRPVPFARRRHRRARRAHGGPSARIVLAHQVVVTRPELPSSSGDVAAPRHPALRTLLNAGPYRLAAAFFGLGALVFGLVLAYVAILLIEAFSTICLILFSCLASGVHRLPDR